jgi:hypothetical protein
MKEHSSYYFATEIILNFVDRQYAAWMETN